MSNAVPVLPSPYSALFTRPLWKWYARLPLQKMIATATAACFLFSFVAAPPVEAVVEAGRDLRQFNAVLDNFVLPSTLGRITDLRDFGSDKVVVNIQDLHCHPEVQRNIARILAQLDKKYRLGAIYVEGAAGDMDTSWLVGIRDRQVKNALVDSLLDQGKLTGTEYFTVLENRPQALKGIEDESLYRANFLRLDRILANQKRYERDIALLKDEADGFKRDYFASGNRRFEKVIAQYREGRLSGVKYYKLLKKYAEKLNAETGPGHEAETIDLGQYGNLMAYLELVEKGKTLNYRRIARQLQSFMLVLKQKLPYRAYNTLLEKTDNFSRLDELYLHLGALVRAYGLDLRASYPDLQAFFDYNESGSRINPVEMVREERRLVREIRTGLSVDINEREISFLIDFLGYYADFLQNRLAAADYAYFKNHFDEFKLLWGKYGDDGYFAGREADTDLLTAFYETNVERNASFIRHLVGEYACSNPAREGVSPADADRTLQNAKEIIVAVTGGFHTEGVQKLLSRRGVSYMAITPNVTQDTALSSLVYTELAKQQALVLSQTFASEPFTSFVKYIREHPGQHRPGDMAALALVFGPVIKAAEDKGFEAQLDGLTDDILSDLQGTIRKQKDGSWTITVQEKAAGAWKVELEYRDGRMSLKGQEQPAENEEAVTRNNEGPLTHWSSYWLGEKIFATRSGKALLDYLNRHSKEELTPDRATEIYIAPFNPLDLPLHVLDIAAGIARGRTTLAENKTRLIGAAGITLATGAVYLVLAVLNAPGLTLAIPVYLAYSISHMVYNLKHPEAPLTLSSPVNKKNRKRRPVGNETEQYDEALKKELTLRMNGSGQMIEPGTFDNRATVTLDDIREGLLDDKAGNRKFIKLVLAPGDTAGDPVELFEAMEEEYLPGIARYIVNKYPIFKTGDMYIRDIPFAEYALVEILKNAIVHGSQADLKKPVYLYIDEANYRIAVIDTNQTVLLQQYRNRMAEARTEDEKSAVNKEYAALLEDFYNAREAGLLGAKTGVKEIRRRKKFVYAQEGGKNADRGNGNSDFTYTWFGIDPGLFPIAVNRGPYSMRRFGGELRIYRNEKLMLSASADQGVVLKRPLRFIDAGIADSILQFARSSDQNTVNADNLLRGFIEDAERTGPAKGRKAGKTMRPGAALSHPSNYKKGREFFQDTGIGRTAFRGLTWINRRLAGNTELSYDRATELFYVTYVKLSDMPLHVVNILTEIAAGRSVTRKDVFRLTGAVGITAVTGAVFLLALHAPFLMLAGSTYLAYGTTHMLYNLFFDKAPLALLSKTDNFIQVSANSSLDDQYADPEILAVIKQRDRRSLQDLIDRRYALLASGNALKDSDEYKSYTVTFRLLSGWIARKILSNYIGYHRLYIARDGGYFHLIDQVLSSQFYGDSSVNAGSSVYLLSRNRMDIPVSETMKDMVLSTVERLNKSSKNQKMKGKKSKGEIIQRRNLLYATVRERFRTEYEQNSDFKRFVDKLREELRGLGYIESNGYTDKIGKGGRLMLADTGFIGTIPFLIKNAIELNMSQEELVDPSTGEERIFIGLVEPSGSAGFKEELLGYEIGDSINKAGRYQGDDVYSKFGKKAIDEYVNILGRWIEKVKEHPVKVDDTGRIILTPAEVQAKVDLVKLTAAQSALEYVQAVAPPEGTERGKTATAGTLTRPANYKKGERFFRETNPGKAAFRGLTWINRRLTGNTELSYDRATELFYVTYVKLSDMPLHVVDILTEIAAGRSVTRNDVFRLTGAAGITAVTGAAFLLALHAPFLLLAGSTYLAYGTTHMLYNLLFPQTPLVRLSADDEDSKIPEELQRKGITSLTLIGRKSFIDDKETYFYTDNLNQLWLFRVNKYFINDNWEFQEVWPYGPSAAVTYNRFFERVFGESLSDLYDVELPDEFGKVRHGVLEKGMLQKKSEGIQWSLVPGTDVRETYVKGALPSLAGVKVSDLSDREMQQVLREMVVDWLFSNFRNYRGNILRDKQQDIVKGINKEKTFEYFGEDRLDLNYQPYGEEQIPIAYDVIARLASEGKLDVRLIDEILASIEKMSDKEAWEIMAPFAEQYTQNNPDSFLEAFIERKGSLRKDFTEFFEKAKIQVAKENTKIVDKYAVDQGMVEYVKEAMKDPERKNELLRKLLYTYYQQIKNERGNVSPAEEAALNEKYEELSQEIDYEPRQIKIILTNMAAWMRNVIMPSSLNEAKTNTLPSREKRVYFAREAGWLKSFDDVLNSLDGRTVSGNADSSVYVLNRNIMGKELYYDIANVIGREINSINKEVNRLQITDQREKHQKIIELYERVFEKLESRYREDQAFRSFIDMLKQDVDRFGYLNELQAGKNLLLIDVGYFGTFPFLLWFAAAQSLKDRGIPWYEKSTGELKMRIGIMQTDRAVLYAIADEFLEHNYKAVFSDTERRMLEEKYRQSFSIDIAEAAERFLNPHPIAYDALGERVKNTDALSQLEVYYMKILIIQNTLEYLELKAKAREADEKEGDGDAVTAGRSVEMTVEGTRQDYIAQHRISRYLYNKDFFGMTKALVSAWISVAPGPLGAPQAELGRIAAALAAKLAGDATLYDAFIDEHRPAGMSVEKWQKSAARRNLAAGMASIEALVQTMLPDTGWTNLSDDDIARISAAIVRAHRNYNVVTVFRKAFARMDLFHGVEKAAAYPIMTLQRRPIDYRDLAMRMLFMENKLYNSGQYEKVIAVKTLGAMYAALARQGEPVDTAKLVSMVITEPLGLHQTLEETLAKFYIDILSYGMKEKFDADIAAILKSRNRAEQVLGIEILRDVDAAQAKQGREIDTAPVENMLQDEAAPVRKAAVEALADLYVLQMPVRDIDLSLLKDRLNDSDPQVGRATLEALNKVYAEAARENRKIDMSGTSEILRNARASVAVSGGILVSAVRLGEEADVSGIEKKVDEADYHVQIVAVEQLGKVYADLVRNGVTVNESFLKSILRNGSEQVKRAAVEAFGELYAARIAVTKEETDITLLENALQAEDQYMRAAAVKAVGAVFAEMVRQDRNIEMTAIERVLSDEKANVRVAAVQALAVIYNEMLERGKEIDLSPLMNRIEQGSSHEKEETIKTLGILTAEMVRRNRPVDAGVMEGLLNSDDNTIRAKTIEALAGIYSALVHNGKEIDSTKLERMLQDPDRTIREKAVEALGVVYGEQIHRKKKVDLTKIEGMTADKDSWVHEQVLRTLDILYTALLEEGGEIDQGSVDTTKENIVKIGALTVAEMNRAGQELVRDNNYKKYVLWRDNDLPFSIELIRDYLKSSDYRRYIEPLKRKSMAVVEKGFDYNDAEARAYAFAGLRAKGIRLFFDEFRQRIDRMADFDRTHPGYFMNLFSKTKGLKPFKISSSEITVLNIDSVNTAVFDRNLDDLLEIKKRIDNFEWFAGHKDFDLRSTYYQFKKAQSDVSRGQRFRVDFSQPEEQMKQEMLANKREMYKAVFRMANKHAGDVDRTIAEGSLRLMHDLIVSDGLLDAGLLEAMRSAETETRIYAFRSFYEDYKNHLPGALDINIDKLKELQKLFEATSEEVYAEIDKVQTSRKPGVDTYTLVPAGFPSVFRGRAGILDCAIDIDKGSPFTRVMHEDTIYYFVYKGQELKGYIGLMQTVTPAGDKVLFNYTISSPSLNNEELLLKLYTALTGVARDLGATGIALPTNEMQNIRNDMTSHLQRSFMFGTSLTIGQMELYKKATNTALKPLHQATWEQFKESFGPDEYNSIDMSSNFKLLPISRDMIENAQENPGEEKADVGENTAASPAEKTASVPVLAQRAGLLPVSLPLRESVFLFRGIRRYLKFLGSVPELKKKAVYWVEAAPAAGWTERSAALTYDGLNSTVITKLQGDTAGLAPFRNGILVNGQKVTVYSGFSRGKNGARTKVLYLDMPDGLPFTDGAMELVKELSSSRYNQNALYRSQQRRGLFRGLRSAQLGYEPAVILAAPGTAAEISRGRYLQEAPEIFGQTALVTVGRGAETPGFNPDAVLPENAVENDVLIKTIAAAARKKKAEQLARNRYLIMSLDMLDRPLTDEEWDSLRDIMKTMEGENIRLRGWVKQLTGDAQFKDAQKRIADLRKSGVQVHGDYKVSAAGDAVKQKEEIVRLLKDAGFAGVEIDLSAVPWEAGALDAWLADIRRSAPDATITTVLPQNLDREETVKALAGQSIIVVEDRQVDGSTGSSEIRSPGKGVRLIFTGEQTGKPLQSFIRLVDAPLIELSLVDAARIGNEWFNGKNDERQVVLLQKLGRMMPQMIKKNVAALKSLIEETPDMVYESVLKYPAKDVPDMSVWQGQLAKLYGDPRFAAIRKAAANGTALPAVDAAFVDAAAGLKIEGAGAVKIEQLVRQYRDAAKAQDGPTQQRTAAMLALLLQGLSERALVRAVLEAGKDPGFTDPVQEKLFGRLLLQEALAGRMADGPAAYLHALAEKAPAGAVVTGPALKEILKNSSYPASMKPAAIGAAVDRIMDMPDIDKSLYVNAAVRQLEAAIAASVKPEGREEAVSELLRILYKYSDRKFIAVIEQQKQMQQQTIRAMLGAA